MHPGMTCLPDLLLLHIGRCSELRYLKWAIDSADLPSDALFSALGSEPALVSVGTVGHCAPGNSKAWYLGRRSLECSLPLAWDFVRACLTESHCASCWSRFRCHYCDSFLGFDGSISWSERFRCDRPDFAQRFVPPKELAALVPDFKVPRIPAGVTSPR